MMQLLASLSHLKSILLLKTYFARKKKKRKKLNNLVLTQVNFFERNLIIVCNQSKCTLLSHCLISVVIKIIETEIKGLNT